MGWSAHIDLSHDERWLAVAMETHFFVIDTLSNAQEPFWENSEHNQPVKGVRWVQAAPWPNQYGSAWVSQMASWLTGRSVGHDDDRLLLFTWSGDGSVRLWDWVNRTEVMRLTEPGELLAADISPNGAQIVTTWRSANGEISPLRIWQTWLHDPVSLIETAQSRLIR